MTLGGTSPGRLAVSVGDGGGVHRGAVWKRQWTPPPLGQAHTAALDRRRLSEGRQRDKGCPQDHDDQTERGKWPPHEMRSPRCPGVMNPPAAIVKLSRIEVPWQRRPLTITECPAHHGVPLTGRRQSCTVQARDVVPGLLLRIAVADDGVARAELGVRRYESGAFLVPGGCPAGERIGRCCSAPTCDDPDVFRMWAQSVRSPA